MFRQGCRALVFFSSRRRHTRFDCDWSSDVCSSDLNGAFRVFRLLLGDAVGEGRRRHLHRHAFHLHLHGGLPLTGLRRSGGVGRDDERTHDCEQSEITELHLDESSFDFGGGSITYLLAPTARVRPPFGSMRSAPVSAADSFPLLARMTTEPCAVSVPRRNVAAT